MSEIHWVSLCASHIVHNNGGSLWLDHNCAYRIVTCGKIAQRNIYCTNGVKEQREAAELLAMNRVFILWIKSVQSSP